MEQKLDNTANWIWHYPTPVGHLQLTATNTHLIAAKFAAEAASIPPPNLSIASSVTRWLDQYFAGAIPTTLPPIAPNGTDFQQQVWQTLCQIPYGTTVTYSALAQRMGNKLVIRAAAAANGKNPIALLVPCHRVVGKNREMVGYAWGIEIKQWLLRWEAQHTGQLLL